eukprot:m.96679 g.96679  ORF g.96679 m.96679 type:complete len:54 (-) comp15055_c0_seq27:1546-1707(-)
MVARFVKRGIVLQLHLCYGSISTLSTLTLAKLMNHEQVQYWEQSYAILERERC